MSGSPWSGDQFTCDYALLHELIEIALEDGIDQKSGSFAKGFDCWVSAELRRAGFDGDQVWPRATMPRVLSSDLSMLLSSVTHGSQTAALREHLQKWVATHAKSSAIAPTEARVLGGVYRKQADVLITDWSTGVELMVSTKSMLGSYGKNLRNRFEESFGDAINLKQRFPLGAFGFLFAIDTGVPDGDFVFLVNMLSKLVDAAGYDAACLVLVDLETKKRATGTGSPQVPSELSPESFFSRVVHTCLDRTPASRHVGVRSLLGLEVDSSEGG